MDTLFNKIIVPVDGSDASYRAVNKAIHLGDELNLPIMALYVIDITQLKGILTPDQVSTIWKNILEEEGIEILKKVKEKGLRNNVKLETQMAEGSPEKEIINHSNKDDLIVIGSKGKNAIDKVFIGSVSENVLHYSKSNVMIIR